MKKLTFSHIILAFLLTLTMAFGACGWSGVNTVNEEEDEFTIQRYDLLEFRYLSTEDLSALQRMQEDYPTETRVLIEGILKIGDINTPGIYKRFYTYYQDSTLQKVMDDVNARYSDMSEEKEDLYNALCRLREIMPDVAMPVVYTQIGDFGESITVDGNSIGISLDKYLGEDYPLYSRYFDENQRKEMTRDHIVPDCLVFYILSLHPLKNFESATQEERDHHLQCILSIVNSILDEPFFENVSMSREEALSELKD